MSTLRARLEQLERRHGGSIVIGILDEDDTGLDGVEMVLISGNEVIPLPEFEQRYPDGLIVRVTHINIPIAHIKED
jgi:hypothetical protein